MIKSFLKLHKTPEWKESVKKRKGDIISIVRIPLICLAVILLTQIFFYLLIYFSITLSILFCMISLIMTNELLKDLITETENKLFVKDFTEKCLCNEATVDDFLKFFLKWKDCPKPNDSFSSFLGLSMNEGCDWAVAAFEEFKKIIIARNK